MKEARSVGPIGDVSARTPLPVRALRRLFGFVGRRVLGFRLELAGAENVPRDGDGRPRGGWIAAGLPHVTWIEPFVMTVLLPAEPRLVWFGDGRVIERSRWRRLLLPRLGGIVPIWPGGATSAFEAHVEAVQKIVAAGAIFAMFPEAGPPAEPGSARPIARGIGYFALRSGAPMVPIVFGGTHELFRGRRIRMEILPAASWQHLAGLDEQASPPAPGTAAERATAEAIAAGLHLATRETVARAHDATEPARGTRKRWRWLTHAFR
ncbi:MAG: lysophospholipid acyltransferase family protein [Candidatus Limnocylindrales bacterium]